MLCVCILLCDVSDTNVYDYTFSYILYIHPYFPIIYLYTMLLYGMCVGFDRKIRVWDILPEPAVRHWNQASDIVR